MYYFFSSLVTNFQCGIGPNAVLKPDTLDFHIPFLEIHFLFKKWMLFVWHDLPLSNMFHFTPFPFIYKSFISPSFLLWSSETSFCCGQTNGSLVVWIISFNFLKHRYESCCFLRIKNPTSNNTKSLLLNFSVHVPVL